MKWASGVRRPEPRPHSDAPFMPRVLFQTVHRLDRSPSQRFRHEQYLEWFRRNGWDTRFSWLLDPAQDRVYYAPGRWGAKAGVVAAGTWKRLKETLRPEADVLFVQREAHMLGTSWFEERMARKVPMVFDFDDAIWLADVSEGNRRFAFLKDGEKTARLIRAATEVIAGNDYLADYARQFNDRVTVIPTTIDTDYHRPMPERRAGKPVCIGWTGSLTTVPYFDAFAPVLMRLKERYGEAIRFKLIGEGAYRHDGLGLQGDSWRLATEVEDLNDIDIGIMPLPDNEWTRGKCGFKGLQYMGCGIPAVLSPVGVNVQIIEDGVNGFLAGGEEEWFDKLCRLVENAGLRERLGAAGRKTVEERYSVRSQRERYLEVLERALRAQVGSRA